MFNHTTPRRRLGRTRVLSAAVLVSASVTTLGLVTAPAAVAATPSLRVIDAAVSETDADRNVCARVQLSRVPNRRTTVDYTTVNGTATAPADYVAKSGTLVFRSGGPRTKNVCTTLKGDLLDESTEQFKVRISHASGASIADAVGVVTVTDDDGPGVSINNVSKLEGWLSPNVYNFTVSLSAPSPETVTVPWSTASGLALAGSDFTGQSGTLTFLPGQTVQTVAVSVIGDLAVEGTEDFFVNLGAPSNATLTDGQGMGTIFNDDSSSFDEGMGAATTMGTMSGDTGAGSLSRFDSILLGDADWYRVTLTENNHDLFSSRDLTARVTLEVGDSPAQTSGDLDLQVFRSNGTLAGSSGFGGTADEVVDVKKSDTPFSIDQPVFFVKVFGFGGNKINN
ncbi:MAG TPA: Calx-beta domain-containing protein, partial [Nocardioides sp.]|nr:Calx-beta domain-containing protein [Nocardioides sp.]